MRNLLSITLLLGLSGAPASAWATEDASVPEMETPTEAPADETPAASEEVPAPEGETEPAHKDSTEPAPTPEADAPAEEVAEGDAEKEQVNPAEDDLTGFAGEVRQKFKDRDWAAAFAGILMILIALLRKFSSKLSGWLTTKRGAWTLNFGSAFGLTVAPAFWTGLGWSWGLIPAAFGFGLAASGGYKAFKDVTGWLFNRDGDDDKDDEEKQDAAASGE